MSAFVPGGYVPPGGPVVVTAADGPLVNVTKASAFILASPEVIEDARVLAAGITEFFERVSDPNYVPPPPWEGPPITPMPKGSAPLLKWGSDGMAERGDAVVRELIELHQPKPGSVHEDGTCKWRCEGCPPDMEYGYPDWPCETTAVIARHLGVEL